MGEIACQKKINRLRNLQAISLPAGGLLAWGDQTWLQYILPSDTWKKLLILTCARLPILSMASRKFDGRLFLGKQQFHLDRVLELLSDVLPKININCIFVNSQRNLPRIYIWLNAGKNQYFLKIASKNDCLAFQNEFDVAVGLNLPDPYWTMRPLSLHYKDDLSILLCEGLTKSAHQVKQRILPRNLILAFASNGVKAEGFFGGPVHLDLSSNNTFFVRKRLLVIDWESAASNGPDYCDLIELAAAGVVLNPTKEHYVEAIGNILQREVSFRPKDVTILESLSFLSDRGNTNAQKLCLPNKMCEKKNL